MKANTSGWFNDTEYSDLTLKLSDDRDIRVHKVIICKSNEFFRGLCGFSSNFAESSQKTISLKDDEADAVEEVIRSIYGCTLGVSNTRPWKYWFDLVIIADKYLEPQPSKDAATNLRVSASIETDADVIVDVISAIKREMSHMDSLLEFADKLRKNNLAKLLRNERYRALLDGDKALMWSQFDELRDTNEDLGVTGLSEKEYFSCPSHTWLLMIRSPAGVLKCPLCKKTELNRRTIWNRE